MISFVLETAQLTLYRIGKLHLIFTNMPYSIQAGGMAIKKG